MVVCAIGVLFLPLRRAAHAAAAFQDLSLSLRLHCGFFILFTGFPTTFEFQGLLFVVVLILAPSLRLRPWTVLALWISLSLLTLACLSLCAGRSAS